MNLQLTVQPLAPAPGGRSLICHSNHGNQLQHYCGAGPVAVAKGACCEQTVRNVGCAVCTVGRSDVHAAVSVKLTVPQLLKKLPTFYETRIFIAVYTTAQHLSLS
jgi:hypothetical protein